MKIVKYMLIFALAYFCIARPHVQLRAHTESSSPKKTVPHSVAPKLGISTPKHIQGVDISHYNGNVDFQILQNADIHFVYMKATQGTSYVDPTYLNRVKQLKTADLPNGAYHFFDPEKDALKQAKHFIQTVHNSLHTLPPMLDVEVTHNVSPPKIKQGVDTWLKYVEQELNCKPVLYSYGSFWKDNLGVEFNHYLFWLADYAKRPTVPKTLENWRVWQYTDSGHVNGVQHQVDRNVLIEEGLSCHG